MILLNFVLYYDFSSVNNISEYVIMSIFVKNIEKNYDTYKTEVGREYVNKNELFVEHG